MISLTLFFFSIKKKTYIFTDSIFKAAVNEKILIWIMVTSANSEIFTEG